MAKIWVDPLTKKKFGSENTYKAFVNSKKYKDLVKQSGQQAPEPIVSLRRLETIGALEYSIVREFARASMHTSLSIAS